MIFGDRETVGTGLWAPPGPGENVLWGKVKQMQPVTRQGKRTPPGEISNLYFCPQTKS